MNRSQNMSPAGHPSIEYTPKCTQVYPVGSDTGDNGWYIRLEDGSSYLITHLPSSYDVPGYGQYDAYREMEAAGQCSQNGVVMPMRKRLPQQEIAIETVSTASQSSYIVNEYPQLGQDSFTTTTLVCAAALGLGYGAVKYFSRAQVEYWLGQYEEDRISQNTIVDPLPVPPSGSVPSPWAGTPISQPLPRFSMSGNGPEAEWKCPGNAPEATGSRAETGGNEVEIAGNKWKQSGNNPEINGSDWKQSGSRAEISGSEAEMDPKPVATITLDDVDYIRNQLSLIQSRSQQSDFYDLDVNNEEAFLRYCQLKDHHNRRTIASIMFNIEGGRKWEQVRGVFDEWDRSV